MRGMLSGVVLVAAFSAIGAAAVFLAVLLYRLSRPGSLAEPPDA